eukprot:2226457-Amphidinium_carterae.1
MSHHSSSQDLHALSSVDFVVGPGDLHVGWGWMLELGMAGVGSFSSLLLGAQRQFCLSDRLRELDHSFPMYRHLA